MFDSSSPDFFLLTRSTFYRRICRIFSCESCRIWITDSFTGQSMLIPHSLHSALSLLSLSSVGTSSYVDMSTNLPQSNTSGASTLADEPTKPTNTLLPFKFMSSNGRQQNLPKSSANLAHPTLATTTTTTTTEQPRTKDFGFLPIPKRCQSRPGEPFEFSLALNYLLAATSTFTIANLYCESLVRRYEKSSRRTDYLECRLRQIINRSSFNSRKGITSSTTKSLSSLPSYKSDISSVYSSSHL